MKIKMKKSIVFVIILALILSLTACGSDKKEDDKTATNTNTSSTSKTEKAASLKPGDSVPDGDKAGPATSDKIYGGADVSDGGSTYTKGDDTAAYDRDGGSDLYSEATLDLGGSRTYMAESKSAVSGSSVPGAASEYYGDFEGSYGEYGGAYVDDDVVPIEPIIWDPEEPLPTVAPVIQPKAGLLTAGEWNDNKNFDFIKKLLADGQNFQYKDFFTAWDLTPFNRLSIKCMAGQDAVTGANVTVLDENGNPIWKGVTDHEGMCYAYYGLLDADMMPATVIISSNGEEKTYQVDSADLIDTSVITIDLSEKNTAAKKLDLMFTIDTTGSMGDEIFYLQKELEDVIRRVQTDCDNIPVRLSVNFYRDMEDDYIVRPYEFTSDINSALSLLNKEYADGGGDYEEAVELALQSSIFDHSWDSDSIKLMFLVLDAPPHNTDAIKESLIKSIQKASEMGIRIIPVASSGVDKNTEFLLRAFAMTTGGTYTFLTNDSGIGGDHIEPTIGEYTVEQLNDLLVRIIEEYIG
ncbi:MAG: VWA domain-containing protein [Lachnospiraceae bacterium]|nr:VWA domain-containing protein [Lachnospiraceae bacterium]